MTTTDGPPTIAVGGGKGGVGKSVVAANLAVVMARLGFRVVLFDADFGAANQHTLFGIDRPGKTVQAFLERSVDSLEEVVVPAGVDRVFLVPGCGAIAGAANLAHARKLKVIRHVKRLDADVVVIDCGAGSSFNVVDFFNAADVRLLVATPQLTSLQNAYAFLKGAVYRTLFELAENARQRDILSACTDRAETERVRDLVERVAGEDSAFALELAHRAATHSALIVGNQVEHAGQENVMYALCRMVGDFLSADARLGCSLPTSRRIHASVTQRRPFAVQHPSSPETRALEQLAEAILVTDVSQIRHDRVSLPEPAGGRPDGPSLGRYLRRHERIRVHWHAEVRAHASSFEAEVVDVSASGAALRGRMGVDVGQRIWLRVFPDDPAGPAMEAVVRYVHGERVAVELCGPDRQKHGALLLSRARRSRAA